MEERISAHYLNKKDISCLYRTNGFVIVKKALPVENLNICKDKLIEICSSITKKVDTSLEDNLKRLFNHSETTYLQTLRTFSKSSFIQSLFLSKELSEIIENIGIKIPIQSTQPVTHVSSKDLLIKDESIGIDSHQDWSSIQGSLDSLVVWVPFTEVTSQDYPVQFLPKSHLHGLRESKVTDKGNIISLSEEEKNNMIDGICSVGDAVIFSTFTIHRTKPQKTKSFRFAASTRFDNALESSFISRDFPCSYKRIVDRNISYIPDKNEIQKVFKK